jgi:hypothetical protein
MFDCPVLKSFFTLRFAKNWPNRDLIRLWSLILPTELLLCFLFSPFFSHPLTVLSAWGSVWLLFRILRRRWGQHRAHGTASLMLFVFPLFALGLPLPNWEGCVTVLGLAALVVHHRRFKKPILLLTACLLGSLAQADTTQSWSGKADITFEGTSTLHNWGGKVSAKPFQTQVTLDAEGKPKRVQAEVIVEAAKMDTAEPKRDENMRKAMKVTEHPLIQAMIDVPADQIAADLKTPTQLPMTLTLLGKPQQITGTIRQFQRKDGKVTFDLDFPVSMKASGISVPSVLLFIRVGDGVKVHASVTLAQP